MAKRRKRTNKNVPAKGRLRDLADKLWSLAVREDWANKCAICGKRSYLNAHHLIYRHNEAVKYLLENGICMCGYCHTMCPKYSPHLNGFAFTAWLKKHHHERALWCESTVEFGDHMRFDGTTNPAYYIEQIRRLSKYVSDEQFVKVVGVQFAEWLEENSE